MFKKIIFGAWIIAGMSTVLTSAHAGHYKEIGTVIKQSGTRLQVDVYGNEYICKVKNIEYQSGQQIELLMSMGQSPLPQDDKILDILKIIE